MHLAVRALDMCVTEEVLAMPSSRMGWGWRNQPPAHSLVPDSRSKPRSLILAPQTVTLGKSLNKNSCGLQSTYYVLLNVHQVLTICQALF